MLFVTSRSGNKIAKKYLQSAMIDEREIRKSRMKCHEQKRMNAKPRMKAPQRNKKDTKCLVSFVSISQFFDKQKFKTTTTPNSPQFQEQNPKDEIRFPPFVLFLLLPHDGDGESVVNDIRYCWCQI